MYISAVNHQRYQLPYGKRNPRNNSVQQCTLQHTRNTHSIKGTLSNNSGLRSFEGVRPHGTAIIS